jgi:hypothetical protein
MGTIGNFIYCSTEIYIHNIVIINMQFHYFSTVYFKENLGALTGIHINVSVRYMKVYKIINYNLPNDNAQYPVVKLPYGCQY